MKFEMTGTVYSRESGERPISGRYKTLDDVKAVCRQLEELGFKVLDVEITPVDEKGNPLNVRV